MGHPTKLLTAAQRTHDPAAGTSTSTAGLTAPRKRRRNACDRLLLSMSGERSTAHPLHSASMQPPAVCCEHQHDHHHHHHAEHAHSTAAAADAAAGASSSRSPQHQLAPLHAGGLGASVTTRIHAAAICCPMESRLIHSILDGVPGVQSVDVMVVTKLVSVRHDPTAISPAALVAALNSAGLQASLNKHGTTGGDGHQHCSGSGCCGPAGAGSSPQAAWQRRLPWLARAVRALQGSGGASVPPRLVLGSGLLLVVNLLLLLPGLPTPPLLRKGVLALIAACIGVVPVLRKAWVGLKNENLDMNCLVVVALFGAIGLGDFFEAGALVVLFTLAEWLEERCVSRAAGAMEDILKLQPDVALVIVQDGGQHQHQQQDAGCCSSGSCKTEATAQHGKSQPCCGHDHSSDAAPPVIHDSGSSCQVDVHACSAGSSDACQHKHGDTSPASGGSCCAGHAADAAHTHDHAASSAGGACCNGGGAAAAGGCHDKQHQHAQHSHQHGSCCEHTHEHTHQHSHSHEGHQCCDHGHHEPLEAAQPEQHQHTHTCSHSHDGPGCGGDQHQHGHEQQQRQHSPALQPVPVSELPVGALVLVRPGDKVPVDGLVEVGCSVVDESMITGESRPVTKAPGEAVLAGTVNCGSVALRVRATAAAGDSTVARLGALMEAAAASKSRHDMAVETFARYYTPTIVAAALLTAGLGSALQPHAWSHWCYMALVVLVTGCPCALVISTPVASVAGLTRAAKKGVLVKSGRALELLGNLDVASFDKSGTLTEGHFQLTKVHTFGGFSQHDVLHAAAALEQHSNHPIAHAVVGAAAARGCMSSRGADAASDVREVAGKGLHGRLQGCSVAVGSWAYAQEVLAAAHTAAVQQQQQQVQGGFRPLLDEDVTAAKQLLGSADTAGCTVVVVVVDGRLGGMLLLSDRARPAALAALEQLQQLGVRCLMMTGDTIGAAAHIAGQLGMPVENVCAELLPQEKLEMIGTIRNRMAVERQRGSGSSHLGLRLHWWQRAGRRGGAAHSTPAGACSSCGELVGECSCRAVLGPNSSSSSGGGIIGGAAAGIERFKRGASAAGGGSAGGAATGASSGGGAALPRVVVAHVGDGINDAPALAGADVGVAIGAGAALAVDAADVALFNNSLTSLPFVVRLGRRAGRVIFANTVFACSIKVAVLAAAAGGVASLWLSLLADVGSSLLVTLHALTLLRFEAGLDAAADSSSTAGGGGFLGRGLSGIPLAGGHGKPVRTAADGSSQQPATWWQRVLAPLLQPYARLSDRTPAASTGVSRFGSLTARGAGSSAAADGGASAEGRQLREISILAGAADTTAAGLQQCEAAPSGGGSSSRAAPALGGGAAPLLPPARGVFVLDDDS